MLACPRSFGPHQRRLEEVGFEFCNCIRNVSRDGRLWREGDIGQVTDGRLVPRTAIANALD
jgi:hypothetical protein